MRLATVATASGPALAFELDGQLYPFREAWEFLQRIHEPTAAEPLAASLDPSVLDDIHRFIEAGETALAFGRWVISRVEELKAEGAPVPPAAPRENLLAPIPRPRKNVFCVGRNYADHAKERGADVPRYPVFFTKAPTTVVGPDARVPYPAQTAQLDYEGELAVIIGKRGRDIPKERAGEYIFGYTIVNDLTARDLQSRHMQFFKGKSLDGTCPMGPVIATADEVGDLAHVALETRVNGEVRQAATVSQMIFDVPTLIENLSDGLTLEPGDIIATGTPSGVGSATGRFLSKRDVVSVSVGPIGTLITYIV